jgi:hypothetical protein
MFHEAAIFELVNERSRSHQINTPIFRGLTVERSDGLMQIPIIENLPQVMLSDS